MEIKLDTKGAKRKLKAAVKATKRGVSLGINDTIRKARSDMSKGIREDLLIKKKDLDRRIDREFSKPDNLQGSVTLKRVDRRIPLRKFRVRQLKRGVKVQIRKTAAARVIQGAFGPKIDKLGRGVFKRAGRARLPLVRQKGVRLADQPSVQRTERRLRRDVPRLLQKNINRQVDRLLKKVK